MSQRAPKILGHLVPGFPSSGPFQIKKEVEFFFPQKSKICKFFFAMRRMTMNVGAFESPDLGGPSRYPQRIP